MVDTLISLSAPTNSPILFASLNKDATAGPPAKGPKNAKVAPTIIDAPSLYTADIASPILLIGIISSASFASPTKALVPPSIPRVGEVITAPSECLEVLAQSVHCATP